MPTPSTSSNTIAVTPVWTPTLQLGEGALWHAASGRFYFVDIVGCAVHAWSPSTDQRFSWPMPERVGWLVPCANGEGFIAGFQSGFVRLTLEPTLQIQPIGSPHPQQPKVRMNDAKADSGGRIWAGSMHHETPSEAHGQLACLHPDGRIDVVERGLHIANGPAISLDSTVLLHTDSFLNTIYRYHLQADGRLYGKTVWKVFSPEEGTPDGMNFDAEGHVWVAFWGGSCVRRFSLDGTLLQQIDVPASNVTNIAFGGADLDLVLITTARVDLSPEQLAAQPLAGSAFLAKPGVKGYKAHSWGVTA